MRALVLLLLLGAAAASKLEKCLCYDPVKDENCDGTFSHQCKDYIKSVALDCWPSVLGMILFILIVPMAAVLLCCCSRKRDGSPSEPPSRARVWVPFGLIALCVIAAAVTSYFTITESEDLADGIEALSDVVDKQVVAKMNNDAHAVQTAFEALPDTVVTPEQVNDVKQFALNFSKQAKDIDDAEHDVLKWDHGSGQWDSRKGLTIAFSVLGIVVIVISLALSYLARPGFSYCVLFFVCLVGTMVSVAALAYQSTETVSTDVCDDYPNIQSLVLLRAHTELGCTDTSTSGVAKLIEQIDSADAKAVVPLLQPLCNSFNCSKPEQTFLAVEAAMHNGTELPLEDPDSPDAAGCEKPCSVVACAVNCTGQLQTDAKSAVDEAGKTNSSMQTLGAMRETWAGCAWLSTAAAEFEGPLCDKVEPRADSLWKAMLALLACVLITAVALLVTATDAQNRRAPRERGYNDLDDDVDIYEVPATQLKTYGTNDRSKY